MHCVENKAFICYPISMVAKSAPCSILRILQLMEDCPMQTIVLTGSTGGLGFALANQFVRKGIGNLICVYRDEMKFQKLFGHFGSNLYSYKTFMEDDYVPLGNTIEALPGDEIVLILNAFSIAPIKLAGEYSYQEIDGMTGGNIRQNVALINEAIRRCRCRSLKLRIINLDSGATDFPLSGWGNYCASKAYLNSFLSVVALENPDFKIVSFDPGVMDTDMQRQIRETDSRVFDRVETFISYKESGRLIDPSAVAEQLIERYVSHWTATGIREKYKL